MKNQFRRSAIMHGRNVLKNIGSALLPIGAALATIAATPAAQAAEVTYNVTQVYNQVVYDISHPDADTIFTGTLVWDHDLAQPVSLTGSLTQAMVTAMEMTSSVSLGNMLSAVYDDTLGGVLVSSFMLDNTDVFSNSGGVAGVNGFATGGTKEITDNNNAYVTVFVSSTNPEAPLTDAQTKALAYGDCTPGSLMGTGSPKTCMTGWLKLDGTAGGTMMGTAPISQTITAVPEPGSWTMLMAGLGMMGFMIRRRRAS